MNVSNLSGMMELMSQGTSGKDPAFLFKTYEICVPRRRMVITRNGLAGIGDDIDGLTLNIDDRLTIDHSLALVSANDADARDIRARSATGILNLMVGSDITDGAGIQIYGRSNGGLATPGLPTPAGITFTAQDYSANGVAYRFTHYTASTNTRLTSFSIDKFGNARFGPNMPTGERLMVDGNLYLYDAADNPRGVRGHSWVGAIDVASGTGSSDGSMIRLYAESHANAPGQVHLFSKGSIGGKAFVINTTAPSLSSAQRFVVDLDGQTHLANDLDFSIANAALPHAIRGRNGLLELYAKNDVTDGAALKFTTGLAHFIAGPGGMPTLPAILFSKYVGGAGSGTAPMMSINNDGKVVVGNYATLSTPGTYKLYVEDGILTEKVRVAVKTTTSWADFVFAQDYKLRPISELAAYVAENKHLPEVPSAQEVVAKGIDMAEMDAKLLQKVEELTLYVIKLQEEIEELKKKTKL